MQSMRANARACVRASASASQPAEHGQFINTFVWHARMHRAGMWCVCVALVVERDGLSRQ